MSPWKKIKARGFINSLEIYFNRLVPSWLFRFSVGDVFKIEHDQFESVRKPKAVPDGKNQALTGTSTGDGELVFRCVDDPADRERLREVTWNSVPIQTTTNDLGFAITSQENPSDFLGGVWGGVDDFIEQNLGFRFTFSRDQAWIYCAYVDDRIRGRGAYQRLLGFAMSELEKRGHDRVYVIIQPWNHASVHVHRKFSSGKVGRVSVLKIFGWSWVRTSGDLIRDKTWTRHIESQPIQIQLL